MKTLRIVLLIFFVQFLSAQQPAPNSVEGVVVRLESNEPLAGATVDLRTDAGVGVVTTTDREGRFIIPNVQPGQYRLLATRSGYVRTEYGQEKWSDSPKPLMVRSGDRMSTLRLVMTPGGVISGRVVDQGQPAASANVGACVISYGPDGQPVWTMVLSGATNDRGEYSIFWLPPGRYHIMADMADGPRLPPPYIFVNPGGGDNPLLSRLNPGLVAMQRSSSRGPVFSKAPRVSDTEMHVQIFFPGTPDWRAASAIDISAGEEVRNVDIDASPVPALHIRGTVTGLTVNAQGQTVRPQVALFAEEWPTSPAIATTQADPNGAFDFPRVRRGTYLLRATAAGPAVPTGRLSVEVRDRDINGVTVALLPAVSVSGRIVLEPPELGLSNLMTVLTTDRAPFISTAIRPAADGTFTITNRTQNEDYRVFVNPISVPPGVDGPGLRQTQTNGSVPPTLRTPAFPALPDVPPAMQNTYVKTITLGNIDVLNDGLHLTEPPRSQLIITIRANAGSIEGQVLNGQQAAAAAQVVLIPESSQRFHVAHKSTFSDGSGRFQLTGVPPGDYKLFAWESIEPGAWQNSDFVKPYESRGKFVRVGEGAKVPVEVPLIPR